MEQPAQLIYIFNTIPFKPLFAETDQLILKWNRRRMANAILERTKLETQL